MRKTRQKDPSKGHVPKQVIKPQPIPRSQNIIHSNRILAILDENQMTQQELADLVFNGDKARTSRVIRNKMPLLSLSTAFRISKVLGRPIEEIFLYRGQ